MSSFTYMWSSWLCSVRVAQYGTICSECPCVFKSSSNVLPFCVGYVKFVQVQKVNKLDDR